MGSRIRRRVLKVIIIRHVMQRFKKRKAWVHPLNQRRSENGEHLKLDEMYKKYPGRFFDYTRLTPQFFDKLHCILGPHLCKQDTRFRKAISTRIRLYVILRYLATGDNLRTIATNFSLGVSTVWYIVNEGVPIIWRVLSTGYVKCPSGDDWIGIAEDFEKKWNYPNCIGALDGKHINITAPHKSGSLYLNYKGAFSIVLMASCDANYKFTTVDVGGYGKQSDGGVFAGSKLGKKLNNGSLDIPPPKELPNSTTKIPFHFIADEAFPLSLFMMRPFPGNALDNMKRIFNYRLSRARRCIENAFGIMAARFRIFRRSIQAEPKYAEWITLAAVALHNFIITEETYLPEADRVYCPPGYADNDDLPNGGWRNSDQVYHLNEIPHLSVAAHERLSKRMREELTTYFNTSGRVNWQNERVGISQ